MQIQKRTLYPNTKRNYIRLKVPKHIQLLAVCLLVIAPMYTKGQDPHSPKKQKFVLTAYYSPMPQQCCYVKGGLKADKILNGEGHTAADGTPVYAGMIAAPPEYAFGTVVELPGLGVFKVHDRGGAIQVLGDDAHRLDVWIGHGEEALAKALSFGVKTIEGTIYHKDSAHPNVSFSFDTIQSKPERLRQYFVNEGNLMAMHPKEGETGLSTLTLQEHLKLLGYFDQKPTGFFGPKTKEALDNFLADYKLQGDNVSNEMIGAHLHAATKRVGARLPLSAFVNESSSKKELVEAQRLLRSIGYYKGRTSGQYDTATKDAIFKFQKDHSLAGTMESPGAGQIGPMTTKTLYKEWNRNIVSKTAKKYLTVSRVDSELSKKNRKLESFLGEGYSGNQVTVLQRILAENGYFPEDKINGNFGPLTKESVAKFQLDNGVVKSLHAASAGYVGPKTLRVLQSSQKRKYYNLVRGQGWAAL